MASILAASLSLPDPFLQPYTKPSGARAAAAGKAPAEGDAAAAAAADAEEEAKAAAEDVKHFKPRLAHHLSAERSEPLTTLSLFEEWSRILATQGPGKAAQYAHSQHASYKRLSEIDALSRELLSKIRQQRVELGLALPPPGGGHLNEGRNLVLHAMLTAAFSPHFAAGRAACPGRAVGRFLVRSTAACLDLEGNPDQARDLDALQEADRREPRPVDLQAHPGAEVA